MSDYDRERDPMLMASMVVGPISQQPKPLPLPKVMLPQKTRKGIVKKARRFDQTYLSADVHGHYVHRDYAAHFFRWGWVPRHLAGVDHHRVLDIGCGPEL